MLRFRLFLTTILVFSGIVCLPEMDAAAHRIGRRTWRQWKNHPKGYPWWSNENAWNSSWISWPSYYAYYGYPIAGSIYYYSFPTNSSFYYPYLLSKLQDIDDKITCLDNPHLILSCDRCFYDELKGNGFYGLSDITTASFDSWKGNFPLLQVPSQGRMIASPVAFIGKVFPTVSYTHPHAPALSVAAHLFDNLTLHRRIREQGGAYGGGATSNALSGNFYFYSYRDPNVASTLAAFQEAVEDILSGNFEESDLEEAKFEMIQALDSPISPGSQGDVAYGWLCEGRTLSLRQSYRTKLLTLSRQDVIDAVGSIIYPAIGKGAEVVFAGKDLLEQANADLQANGKPPLILETV